MPPLNLKAAFFPVYRASPDEFWLALGVIALIDALRMSLSPVGGLLTWLLIVFFVTSAFINRLRDAGRKVSLAVVPLAGAVIAKMAAGLIAMTGALYPDFLEFLAGRGIDLNDPAAVQAAAYDANLQEAYRAHLDANPDYMFELLAAAAWPSLWGFWIVAGAFALWFSRMPQAARL